MKLLYTSLSFLFFLFSALNTTLASHVPGGNITYQCVGANQFLVTLTLFEDCGTAFEANGTQTLQVANSCGITGLTSITLANTIYQQEVSQLCPALIGNSECNGGTLPGIYMHQWQTVVTLPAQCTSWTFSYTSCCRNTTNNLNGTPAYYWESTLNNAAAPCNNSPTVTTQMIPYVCVNQPVVYNLGIFEPDGHSLSYSLINALSASGTPVVYTAPFSGASPITGATINSNGNISFTATVTGNYVFSVLVQEYNSNGVLVGSIIQDFQFEVINCPANTNPVVPSGIINYTGDGTVIAPNEIELCIGDSFCFELEFTDLNSSDSIFISSNIGLALPGATVTQLTFQSPAIAQVCWTATASVPGNNTVVFNAKDNACPMFGITFYPVKVTVIQSTNAGPDQTLCAGDDAIINATGGSVFNWSVLPGGDTILIGNNFNCNPCANVIASPSITTTYVVTSDLTIGCGNIDTVTINVVDDFTYTLTQSSNAGCINDNIYFSSITNPPGAYQYTWSPATYLNSTTVSNPIVTPTTSGSIDYAVQILGPTGCTKYDTLSINVAASFKPDVTLMVNPTNVVCGDSVFLDVQLNGGSPASCGPSANNSCVAPSTQHVIGNAVGTNTTTSYPAPFANWYRNAKHQFLFTAAELNSMGITGGKLTEIAWEVFQINGTINYNQYTVKLGCTSQTALTNTWVTGLTTVFTPQNIVITTGWNTLPFTTAYEWDGLSNIVVEICYNNLATNFTQNSITPFTTTAVNSSIFYFSDATPACPSLAASAGSPSPNRPVTRFGFCPTLPDPVNYTFQWTPSSSIDDATAQTTFALPQNNTTFQLVTTFINGGCTDTSSINVTVNCCETPLINSTNISCFGGNNGQIEVTPISTTLPPYTVQLIDPISSIVLQNNTNVMSSVSFSNLIAGNYLVSTIDANGCIADTLVLLSEPNLLSISISNDTNICVGDSVQLSAFGGALYSWSPITNLSNPTNANTWYTGTTTQLFTVLVTDTNGCSNSDSVLITVNSLPTVTLTNDTTICEKDTLQLLATGGTIYNWTPSSSLNNNTINNPFAFPTTSTTYQVVVTNSFGCKDSASVSLIVQTLPNIVASTDVSICLGDTTQLAASGGLNYTWQPVLNLSNNLISNPLAWPTTTTEYIVFGEDALGCVNSDSVVVTVNALPNVIVSNDLSICMGDTTQLTASGALNYTWQPALNLSNNLISNPLAWPTTTTEYIVFGEDALGCFNSDSVLVTVNALPTILASNDLSICWGDTTQLTASGALNYTWQPALNLSNNLIGNPLAWPTTTTEYIVFGEDALGCVNSDSVLITVNALPTILASSDVSICIGDTIQLIASGALNYTWQPVLNLSNNLISNPLSWPTTTTEYIVVGEDALGCINSDSVTITVNTLPTIDAGLDVWLCPGSDIQLTAIGTGNFNWTPTIGLTDPTISNPFANPLDTTLYIVELTDNNGCKNTDTVTVFVSPRVPTDAGLSQTICEGNSIVIGGNPTSVPGTIFSWTPTSLIVDATLSNPTVLPTLDTWFIVHTSNDTCNGVDSVLVQVNPYPLANAGNDIQICIGDSIQFNATGGVGYTWLPNQDISNPTINNPTVWPSDTTQYIVTVTDNNGCVQSDSVWVIVNPLPSLFAGNDEIICINDSVQLNAIGTGNFSWSPTIFMTDNTLSNPIVFPIMNTTYTVVLTDSNGCVNSDSLLVTVNNLPPVNAGIDVSICFNDSIQLQASGAVNYNWTLADGLVNTNISNPFVSPNSTIQYIVFGTDANLCTNSDTVQVTVFNLPLIDAGNDVQICIFDTTQLAASGGVSYTWSPTIGLSSISVSNPFANPTATQEYIVEGVDVNNCFNSDTVVVTVVPLPIANAGIDVKICLGDTIQLTATGGIVYNWSPSASLTNSNTDVTNAFPDTSTQYIVTVTDVNTCVNFDTVVVEVFRISTINDTTICLLDSVQLDVFGSPGVLFSWTPIDYLSDPTIANPIAKPIENTTYTISVTDIDGCQDQASVTISVNELPQPFFNYSVEPGCEELIVHFSDSSSLTDTYLWNFGNGTISNEVNPTINFTYNQQYEVELVASNNFGCSASYTTILTAEDFEVYYSIYIPNVFTPNGDGENDAFFIDVPGKLYDCLDFRIYNRWGQLIYKSVGDALNWDGKSYYGDSMPDGTYFFTVEIKDKKYSGTINLFR